MRGIPGDIGGNSMSIPPEICPGVGDFPRFSVIIMIAPETSRGGGGGGGAYIQMTSALYTCIGNIECLRDIDC